MGIAIWIGIGVVLGGGVGMALGRSGARAKGLEQGRREAGERLWAAAEAVSRGRMPEGATEGSPEGELHRALEAGWAPRDSERQVALRQSLERVGLFLDRAVRAPLSGGTAQSDPAELRERMDRALGALEDLEFFLKEVPEGTEGQDIGAIVKQVSREFALDQNVSVRLSLDSKPVRGEVNTPAFMDALYLLFHNAARFGKGATVDVAVVEDGGRAVVRIRDRGEGFSEEAFQRAFDPFYSTSPEGLGLGLPHARKVLEGMGGRLELRNMPDGGAEVEASFPVA